nr:DJ-1/PfpI family protein [Campylobacter sp.]
MKKVAVILADGFEEIEAMSILDILRRGGVEALAVGLENTQIKGAHGLEIISDVIFESVNFANIDMIVLPGGLPGSEHLAKSAKLQAKLKQLKSSNKKIAAICAAPWALKSAEVLGGSYTCYPGFEAKINHLGYTDTQNVIIDGNIITSKGPATAMEFALVLLKELEGETKFKEVKAGLLA